MYSLFVKRLLDIIISLVVIVLFSWLYLILFILVRTKLGSPVLFKQIRVGYNRRRFCMLKFRSMAVNDASDTAWTTAGDPRRTKFGAFMRSTSLDELPELFNIFIGDMSIVGPRPLAVSYLKYYTEQEHHRHDVRPGLTGLAQISGRNGISWEEKFRFDLQYIENISFSMDARILFATIWKVLKKDGIGQGEEAPVSLSIQRMTQAEKGTE